MEKLKEIYNDLRSIGYRQSFEQFCSKVEKGVKICFKDNDGVPSHFKINMS